MAYEINVSGPTASYAGDPNDYTGGGSNSGLNPNSVVDAVFNNFGDTLSGIAAIIGATKGNPVVTQPGQVYTSGNQPNNQQQQTQSNTVLYVVLAIVFLLVILGAAYFLTRK